MESSIVDYNQGTSTKAKKKSKKSSKQDGGSGFDSVDPTEFLGYLLKAEGSNITEKNFEKVLQQCITLTKTKFGEKSLQNENIVATVKNQAFKSIKSKTIDSAIASLGLISTVSTSQNILKKGFSMFSKVFSSK